jgi:hypothetical protein
MSCCFEWEGGAEEAMREKEEEDADREAKMEALNHRCSGLVELLCHAI